MGHFLLSLVCGGIIAGAIYCLFFRVLEWGVRRDEGKAPIANSYRSAAERMRKSDKSKPR